MASPAGPVSGAEWLAWQLDALRDPLARALGPVPRPRVLGLEWEFRVLRDGAPVDFRMVIRTLTAGLPRLHPSDPNAVHLPCGVALTADGWEAELITPPIPLGPHAPRAATLLLERGLDWLAAAIADHLPGARLEGFSTHLNLAVPDRAVVGTARRLASRHGAALLALADAPESAGILVRPRHGRLEVGTDFQDAPRAEASLAALVGLVEFSRRRRLLGPDLTTPVEPARERFGFFLPPQGAGVGRAVRPGRIGPGRKVGPGNGGRSGRAAEAVAPVIERLAARVLGRTPSHDDGAAAAVASSAVVDLGRRERPWGTAVPEVASWAAVAWRCRRTDGRNGPVLLVPRHYAQVFLEQLEYGALDRLVEDWRPNAA